jgi:two-component system phosphate regulon response regulator PhoB
MRNQIFIVQPDQKHRAVLCELLERYGHQVEAVASVKEAETALRIVRPDAVFLHWNTPTNMRMFLEHLAAPDDRHRACVFVTAHDEELSDALSALDMGYDDCIRLPAEEAELIARLNASLRRRFGVQQTQLTLGRIMLDRDAHCLYVDDQPVTLAPTEYRLLTFFLENPGRVFSRNEILAGAWHRNVNAGSRTVDVHVRRLRQVLEPYGCDDMIQTVRSFGYRFSATSNADAISA